MLFVIACIVALFIWFCVIFSKKKEAKEIIAKAKDEEETRAKIAAYKTQLARKRKQLIVKDDYGDYDTSRWKKEMTKFYTTKINSEYKYLPLKVLEMIDEVAIEGEQENSKLYTFDESMSGVEYEHYCADILRQNGWVADVSKASNDQGVDIIAKLESLTVAIQCKKYSKPVGNKAVQEILAGQSYYEADLAVVVSNNTYTKSAHELANSTGIILLHHEDLIALKNEIKVSL